MSPRGETQGPPNPCQTVPSPSLGPTGWRRRGPQGRRDRLVPAIDVPGAGLARPPGSERICDSLRASRNSRVWSGKAGVGKAVHPSDPAPKPSRSLPCRLGLCQGTLPGQAGTPVACQALPRQTRGARAPGDRTRHSTHPGPEEDHMASGLPEPGLSSQRPAQLPPAFGLGLVLPHFHQQETTARSLHNTLPNGLRRAEPPRAPQPWPGLRSRARCAGRGE